ncbi:MAG: LysR family transcriptional regulator [Natronospirillum sp.]|uniref:LysR family transcriptional regulator n=1 Tax=Natronospirillum sp. TaxID=2812955 RepID=UPI0025DB4DE4|nr:LysR family transcriptional regulator [Natronospirillum sp.]MCH8551917.1 LysR family transcriptional regulator [Natronospirillum sp.]
MIRLQDLDLNLLVTFQLLYREQKMSAVAETMELSQPAVSHALNRLRKIFDDELFYRTARGMRPTALADQLAEPLFYALSTIEHSVNLQNSFDPATSTRQFCIVMTDIGEVYFLPRLMAYLAEQAPGIRLTTVRANAQPLESAMESGAVDLAIGLLPHLTTGFYQKRLFAQTYVCLMRGDHPLATRELDRDTLLQAEHAIVVAEGTGHSVVEKFMVDQGLPAPVRLRLPHFVAVPYVIQNSDMVVTVPEKLAQSTVEPFGLTYRPHPFKLPTIQINQFWHRRFHQDAGNRWLRGAFAELFTE